MNEGLGDVERLDYLVLNLLRYYVLSLRKLKDVFLAVDDAN